MGSAVADQFATREVSRGFRFKTLKTFLVLAGLTTITSSEAFAKISIEPFASVSSTKQIKPNKAGQSKNTPATTETEIIKQRTTYGVRGSISFFRIVKFQLGIGQNQLATTSKTSQAVDDYGEIDFKKDLNMDTSTPDKEVKVTETQKKGTAVLVVDPSFSIFVLRGKAGVVATQRELKKEEQDKPAVNYVSPISYKPTVGGGAGVRFGPRSYFIAEYSLFLYKFPEKAPFEREVTVTYGLSI
jgi:hypothetical protein